MKSHTLITAYTALATVAVGLLAYFALRPDRNNHVAGKMTVESVAQEPAQSLDPKLPQDHPRIAVK
jgi:hypothetical protein